MTRVLIAGGGTGGHLYPALAIGAALRERLPGALTHFVGARRGVEARVLPLEGVPHTLLPLEPIQRDRIWRNWRLAPSAVRSVAGLREVFRDFDPELFVGTGGYASGPAGAWALLTGVPVALQEQNSYPGLTTRILGRRARRIFLGFPEARRHLSPGRSTEVLDLGNPIRPPDPAMDRGESRRRFGLDAEGTVVLVVGGSQGALALNEALLAAISLAGEGRLPRLPPGVAVLWATGPAHIDAVSARLDGSQAAGIRAVGYIDDMPAALAAADIAISRAGAIMTAELLAWGLPSILVPLPTAAADHQRHNARALERAGAALYLDQEGLEPAELWRELISLTTDSERRGRMAAAARERARPDAAARIADSLAELLGQGQAPVSRAGAEATKRDATGPGAPRVPRSEADHAGAADRDAAADPPDLIALSHEGPVHFVGISGAGMSVLAELIVRAGGRVSGCDLRPGAAGKELRDRGAEVVQGHDVAHVAEASAVVATAAVPASHPELEAARARGIPVLKRAAALGALVNRGTVVAVAGTHGKTSTTAMTTLVLAEAGVDPTAMVGGRVPAWGGGLRLGGQEVFVVEADEYDRSFHTLRPSVAVITTLEKDHTDVYGSLEAVEEAFDTFLAPMDRDGLVIICSDDPGAARLLTRVKGPRTLTYGVGPEADVRAVDVRTEGRGSRFTVTEQGNGLGELRVGSPGVHSVRNALAAFLAARSLGARMEDASEALAGFQGVARRFQELGGAGGVTVVDDYAHHPTEVEVTIDAARRVYPGRRIVALFQPHLYTRTRDFADDFGRVLAAADAVWVTDVYAAREQPIEGVSGALVADAIRSAAAGASDGIDAGEIHYHPDATSLPGALVDWLRPGDVLLALGAGNIDEAARTVLSRLEGAS